MKLKPTLSILTAALLLTACSWPTKPSTESNPLVISSCPVLTPLASDTMGGLLDKLVEVSGQYYECREAALGGKKPAK